MNDLLYDSLSIILSNKTVIRLDNLEDILMFYAYKDHYNDIFKFDYDRIFKIKIMKILQKEIQEQLNLNYIESLDIIEQIFNNKELEKLVNEFLTEEFWNE